MRPWGGLRRPRPAAERVYLLLSGVSWACFTMFATAATLYRIRVAGLDPLELVLVGTALELTVFVAEVPTGVVADRYSRRLSIVIGFAVMGAGFAFEGLVRSFWPILAAQVVWGVGYTFTSGATQAWIAGEVGDERAPDVLMRGAAARRVGGLAGVPAGILAGLSELGVPLVASGALLTAFAVGVRPFMPEEGFHRAPDTAEPLFTDVLRDGARAIRGRPILVAFFAVVFFVGVSSEAFDRLWQLHLVEGVGIGVDVPEIVVVGAVGFVVQILGFFGLHVVRRRVGVARTPTLARALLWITVGSAGALAGLALAPGVGVALAAVFAVYVFRVLQEPVADAWVVRQVSPRVRATVLSAFGQGNALGEIAGGPGMGLIARRVALTAAFWASAAALAPAAAVYAKAAAAPDDEPVQDGTVTGEPA